MSIKEIQFSSANGRDQIYAWQYTPVCEPKGVVQLIHGFGEHSRRYLHLIGQLNEAGFIVVADDHAAHGKTAQLGNCWGDPGDHGFMTYIEDERRLYELTTADFPGLPYMMFGHSWGSMIARKYAALYGEDLTASAWCGLVAQMKGCEIWKDSEELARAVQNKEDGGMWFAKIFGSLTERIDNPEFPTAWVAKDPDVVRDHAADPFNCMTPDIQLIYDFVNLYADVMSEQWAGQIPTEQPVYILAGDQDPCGNYGEGVYHVANRLAEAGCRKITVRCYSGYRHEIHNEPELRNEVAAGVINFFNNVLNVASASTGQEF